MKILKFEGERQIVNISQIKEYEFNNKIHGEKQINLLNQSISDEGYLDEILVNKDFVIIAGHGRLQSAKELGFEKIEVKIIDPKNEKKLRLTHNKIASLAEDNLPNIKIELDELNDLELNELYDLKLEGDFGDDFKLPSGEKGEIETVTFTLHKTQNEQLERAIEHSKSLGDFGETGNENSNGNALARIIETYNTQNEC